MMCSGVSHPGTSSCVVPRFEDDAFVVAPRRAQEKEELKASDPQDALAAERAADEEDQDVLTPSRSQRIPMIPGF
eukprot:4045715-Prorocentrum_lima.AAC.1